MALTPDVKYYARARHRGNTYGVSDWGETINFTPVLMALDTEEAILTGDATGTNFGRSLQMDTSGMRCIIGAYKEDPSAIADAGAAYIFVRSESGWTREAKLTASDKESTDYFGYSVSISGDGSRCIVGAYQKDPDAISNAGLAYVFVRSGYSWIEEAKIKATDKQANDIFAFSVFMNYDGTRCIVSAHQEDPGTTSDAGSAYVFVRSGSTWTEEAKLIASDKAATDNFSYSVAISGDGTRCIVGSRLANYSALADAGAAYIFVRTDTSWAQETKLISSHRTASDYFGTSVSISFDGSRCIVGSPNDDDSTTVKDTGAAFIFIRSGTNWIEEAMLSLTSKVASDLFGQSVSISNDGTRCIVGSHYRDIAGVTNSGAAYNFILYNSAWIQECQITPSEDYTLSGNFGFCVSVAGNGSRCLVGTAIKDRAYVFS